MILHACLKVHGEVAASSDTRRGDWHGNLIRIGRPHALLFISEHSRLPVLLPVRQADRLAARRDELDEMTLQWVRTGGIPRETMAGARGAAEEAAERRHDNRVAVEGRKFVSNAWPSS
jgi:hypothetical protein